MENSESRLKEALLTVYWYGWRIAVLMSFYIVAIGGPFLLAVWLTDSWPR